MRRVSFPKFVLVRDIAARNMEDEVRVCARCPAEPLPLSHEEEIQYVFSIQTSSSNRYVDQFFLYIPVRF